MPLALITHCVAVLVTAYIFVMSVAVAAVRAEKTVYVIVGNATGKVMVRMSPLFTGLVPLFQVI